MVAMHNKSMGEMNNEHSGNKEGLVISEMNCRKDLDFDHYTIEVKDIFHFVGFTKSTDVIGEESPISMQKL